MARVYPGSDFQDIYDARNIVSGNIQGDDYKVRRSANDSNLDPRTNSEWQNKIIDAMSLAARIWSNKRNCWKDHFKRSNKTFEYKGAGAEANFKTLTGYKLAINMIMSTLKTGGVDFYDPSCFCITPTDLFGEPLNTYSILDIEQTEKLNYKYLEKKLTYDILQSESDRFDKFCSAVGSDLSNLQKCLLSSVGCVSRNNTFKPDYRELSKVKNIVQWPNLWFETVDQPIGRSFGLWYTDFFTYFKIPTEDLPVQDGSMRGVQITLGYPFTGDTLCSLGNLQITLYFQYESITGFIQDTPNPPFFNIYYGNTLLGTFGSGGGGNRVTELNFPDNFLTGSPNTIKWNEYLYPVIPGYQVNMYPPGKLTECRLMGTEVYGEETGLCQWQSIYQFWDAGTQIEFHPGNPTVLAKFNIWSLGGCDDGTIYCAYPFGAILNVSGSNDLENWYRVSGSNQIWPFDPHSSALCVGYSQYHFPFSQSFRYFRTYISTSIQPSSRRKCNTFLGDPTCQPVPINDHCLGPAPGTRGLFFLEKSKPFEIKPVACKCPEYGCPHEFPDAGYNPCTLSHVRRCPDDPTKAYIGDECVPCIGASQYGLVYDYLR